MLNSTIRIFVCTAVLLFVLLGLPMRAQGATPGVYTDLSTLPGLLFSHAYGVSGDGSVVVGLASTMSSSRAFRWTSAGGMVDLGALGGGTVVSRAYGVSGDGSVVVGYFRSDSFLNHAFRWTTAPGLNGGGTMTDLGTLTGGDHSEAYAVSSDGSVVVGYSQNDSFQLRAVRWTSSDNWTTPQNLGVLDGGTFSYAHGVSGDGSVVVGYSQNDSFQPRAVRWTSSDSWATPTIQNLGTLTGGTTSFANAVSSDGNVVVGISGSSSGNRAVRWTSSDNWITPTLQNLGVLDGGTFSSAKAASSDGRVVVGQSGSTDGNRAFRWTEATGMQTVEQWLRDSGVTVDPSMTTAVAYGVNEDGSVVVGTLSNGHAFYARGRSGLITIDQLCSSLVGTCPTPMVAMTPASLVLHGVHSRPLSRRVASGKNTFWTSGDLGRDDHGANDGDTGLMEFGLGRNFGSYQVNLALGRAWANQNLNFDGDANVSGTYAQGDLLVPLHGNLWGVLGGFYMGGTAEVRRGYDNAGTPDFSDGRASTSTWGLRGRLEWDKATSVGQLTVSPYGELSHLRTQIDGYTETSGGFPAVFNSREETATEVRVGADLEYPLFVQTKLIGLMEGVHRFEQDGARVSGTVTGLSSFDFAGVQNTQNWLRFGAGFETAMAGGKLALMVNTTTRGQAANLWGNLTWSLEF